MGAKIAALASPFITAWKKEPVLLIAAAVAGATVAYPAWKQGGITTDQAVQLGIDAAIACLIRWNVWSPNSVEALGETDD